MLCPELAVLIEMNRSARSSRADRRGRVLAAVLVLVLGVMIGWLLRAAAKGLGLSRGDVQVKSNSDNTATVPLEIRCEKALERLVEGEWLHIIVAEAMFGRFHPLSHACLRTPEQIRLVAIDFDMTIVDVHTGGRWKESAAELMTHVRPEFECLIEGCLERGIHVAVATFSAQKELLREVLVDAIQTDIQIPIYGGDDTVAAHLKGKQSQLILARWYFEKRGGDGAVANIVPQETVLIDDDGRNILIAQEDGYRTVHYNPKRSQDQNALMLEKRA